MEKNIKILQELSEAVAEVSSKVLTKENDFIYLVLPSNRDDSSIVVTSSVPMESIVKVLRDKANVIEEQAKKTIDLESIPSPSQLVN